MTNYKIAYVVDQRKERDRCRSGKGENLIPCSLLKLQVTGELKIYLLSSSVFLITFLFFLIHASFALTDDYNCLLPSLIPLRTMLQPTASVMCVMSVRL